MKLDKIYNELLKDIINKNRGKYWMLMEVDSETVYLADKYRVFVIKKEEFPFDIKWLYLNDVHRTTAFPNLEFEKEFYNGAQFTGNIRKHDKADLYEIRNLNDEGLIYANKKFFDVFENYQIKATKYNQPVLILENNEPRGLVLPVKVGDKNA